MVWPPTSIAPYHPFSDAQAPDVAQAAANATPANSFDFTVKSFSVFANERGDSERIAL
jgi:hypothetical protein